MTKLTDTGLEKLTELLNIALTMEKEIKQKQFALDNIITRIENLTDTKYEVIKNRLKGK